MRHGIRRTAVNEAFAELVYADRVWLRTEFESIIAASFGDVSRIPPRRSWGLAPSERSRAARTARPARSPTARPCPAVHVGERWMRQRSPPVPVRESGTAEGKAGDVIERDFQDCDTPATPPRAAAGSLQVAVGSLEKSIPPGPGWSPVLPVTWDEVRDCRRPAQLVFTADDVLDRVNEHGDLDATRAALP